MLRSIWEKYNRKFLTCDNRLLARRMLDKRRYYYLAGWTGGIEAARRT